MADLEHNDSVDVEAFNQFFGITPENNAGATNANEPEESDTGASNDNPESTVRTDQGTASETEGSNSGQESGQDSGDQSDNQDNANLERSNAAFAQMRVENKRQAALLKNIADVIGLPNADNPELLIKGLQETVLKAQSQKQGVPQEVLYRLQQLEERDRVHTQQQAVANVNLGLKTLQDTYSLSQDDLKKFANELIADGVNPFEQPVDFVREYKIRHFDELIQKAVDEGIAQEATRAAKANASGSTPNSKSGGTEPEPKKINTMAELEAWGNSLNK